MLYIPEFARVFSWVNLGELLGNRRSPFFSFRVGATVTEINSNAYLKTEDIFSRVLGPQTLCVREYWTSRASGCWWCLCENRPIRISLTWLSKPIGLEQGPNQEAVRPLLWPIRAQMLTFSFLIGPLPCAYAGRVIFFCDRVQWTPALTCFSLGHERSKYQSEAS